MSINASKNIVLQNAICFTFLSGTLCTAFDSFCEFQSEKQMAFLIDINHVK